jgi:hypothetical protein
MFGPAYNSCKIRQGDKIASVSGVDIDGSAVAFPAARSWRAIERDAYFAVTATYIYHMLSAWEVGTARHYPGHKMRHNLAEDHASLVICLEPIFSLPIRLTTMVA